MSADRNVLSSFDASPNSPLFAVVMAGGPGSRLWPESRKLRPKPFLPLLNDGRSLFRATLDRLDGLVSNARRLVVAGKGFETLVRNVAPELDESQLLLEPVGRDTASCVAWTALEALKRDPNATLLVLPSDHWIRPDDQFRQTIERAVKLVQDDPTRLVTLGIRPTEPSSAYGYIELGAQLEVGIDAPCQVARFCEKPDGETARQFLASGRFLWNAGIFVWRAQTFLELLERFEPELFATLQKIDERLELARQTARRLDEDDEFTRLFSNAKRISVDYAVLERAPNVVVLPVESFEWDDLGSYDALETMASRDNSSSSYEENRCVGAACVAENARGNFVRFTSDRSSGDKRKLVAFVGVDDLLVVETDDVLLIAKKGDAAALKRIVEKAGKEGLEEFL